MKFISNNKGQGLVELIIAIAVIEIGIFSVWSLFLINFNAEREAEMRIVGTNLAREGVEVIKNIRDSNWLKNNNNEFIGGNIWPWDEKLAAGDYTVNYDSDDPEDAGLTALYRNSDGFFTNIEGDNTATPYQRKITIKDICCDDDNDNFQCDSTDYNVVESSENCPLKIGLKVISEVTWQISGRSRSATVEDNLYNWR
ncbi:MAG: hypothetical protein WC517_03960 [Patescibacteria group bacterium]